jgi:hypothetical protein
MIVYKMDDRIPVVIGDAKFWVSPLSYEQKIQLAGQTKIKAGEEVSDPVKAALLTLKFSVKEVEGLKCADGSDYHAELDPSGILTDACVSEIFQLETAIPLVTACTALAGSVKEHDIPGVKIDMQGVRVGKKK